MKTLNFVLETFTKGELPPFYTSISNTYNNEFVFKLEKEEVFTLFKKKALVVEDVPGYFQIQSKSLPKGIKLRSLKFYPGFLINFEGVESLDAYLNSRFGKNSRYKLRRDQKKLESSFDIRYKMYFGDISKVTYNLIFEEFYRLLEIRSLEKGIKKNRNLKTKKFYYQLVYPMILEKKASFYVIYNGAMPIDICLNFHIHNTIFQFIRTYDINYSKFNTGYIDLMKQIEWCLLNDIKLISFSKGDFYWKRRWCNTVYDYEYHVFYDSKHLVTALNTKIYYYKKRFKQYVREKNVIAFYHSKKEWLIKHMSQFKNTSWIEKTPLTYDEKVNNIEKLDINSRKYAFLKKSVFDFLYEHTIEKEKDLETYLLKDCANSYLIVGTQNKIVLKYHSS